MRFWMSQFRWKKDSLIRRTVSGPSLQTTDLRIARLMGRMGISEEEAELRISAQMTNREYEAIADVTILNEAGTEELKKLVLFELKRFLAG